MDWIVWSPFTLASTLLPLLWCIPWSNLGKWERYQEESLNVAEVGYINGRLSSYGPC